MKIAAACGGMIIPHINFFVNMWKYTNFYFNLIYFLWIIFSWLLMSMVKLYKVLLLFLYKITIDSFCQEKILHKKNRGNFRFPFLFILLLHHLRLLDNGLNQLLVTWILSVNQLQPFLLYLLLLRLKFLL